MTGTDSFEVLAYPFARGLLDKSLAVNDPRLSPYQRSRLRESLGVDVRKLGDMAVPAARPPRISEAARSLAEGLGVDLLHETWQSQPGFDPGRTVFHYEHMATVSTIVDAMRDVETVTGAMDTLYDLIEVAWITKGEDARLTALGYKSKRPDPAKAYTEAGIRLLPQAPEPPGDEYHTRLDEAPGLLAFLDAVLQEDIIAAQDSHELSCGTLADPGRCDCRLGRRLASDATEKRRILSQLHLRSQPELLHVVAAHLAFPYRDRSGYRQEWMP